MATLNTHFIQPSETDKAEAQKIIHDGYYQTSRKFRHLARLPHGKTGKQALVEAVPERMKAWAEALRESSAGDQYLCCYCPQEDKLEVSQSVFWAFRELGGGTYRAKNWESDEEEITWLFICEVVLGSLRPNRTYRFKMHPDCENCRHLAKLGNWS